MIFRRAIWCYLENSLEGCKSRSLEASKNATRSNHEAILVQMRTLTDSLDSGDYKEDVEKWTD